MTLIHSNGPAQYLWLILIDHRLKCTIFRVIVDTDDQTEVSFSRPYDPAVKDNKVLPMDVDLRSECFQSILFSQAESSS